MRVIPEWADIRLIALWRGYVAWWACLMNQGLIEGFISSRRAPAVALKALIRATRLATSFTRLTPFAERPVAVLGNALELWSAVALQKVAYCI